MLYEEFLSAGEDWVSSTLVQSEEQKAGIVEVGNQSSIFAAIVISFKATV